MELEIDKIPQRLIELHLKGYEFDREYDIDLMDCWICSMMVRSLELLCESLRGSLPISKQ